MKRALILLALLLPLAAPAHADSVKPSGATIQNSPMVVPPCYTC